MQLNEGLAEVVGAFIGDGCISEYFAHGRGTRTVVLFTGHWKNDRQYYMDKIAAVITEEFGCLIKLYHRKDDNTIRYVLTSKKVVGFFKELGLPVGEKGNKLGIPGAIMKDDKLVLACVRGIFNTDGSIYRRYSKRYSGHARVYRNYAVIQFKMVNHKVIRRIKCVLEKYCIKVNNITKVLNCSVIRITDQTSIKKFISLIGFTHPYHEKRYLDIVGMIPTRNLD